MDHSFLPVFALSVAIAVAYLYLIIRRNRDSRTSYRKYEPSRLIPMAVAATSAMIAMTTTFFQTSDRPLFQSRAEVLSLEMSAIAERIKEIEQFQSKQIKNNYPVPLLHGDASGAKMPDEIAHIKRDLAATQSSIKKFEEILMTNAEQVVTLPLLKSDIKGVHNEVDSLRQQVAAQSLMLQETQTQNRWVIGTLALGMLALIIPAVRAGSQNKADRDE